MSKQRVSKEYQWQPLVIDEQGLRRLYDELLGIVGQSDKAFVRFHVQFSDKSRVENWTLDDVLADENRSFRRIKTIEIEAEGRQHEIFLKLGEKRKGNNNNEQFFPLVILDVAALDRQRVFVVQSLIEDRIKSLRPNRPPQWTILFFCLVALVVADMILIFILPPYLPSKWIFNGRISDTIVLIVTLIGLASTLIALFLFPDFQFLLGRGLERHARLERIKANIFWAGIVGLIVSVIGGYLLARFQ